MNLNEARQCGCGHRDQGWDKRQATIQLTIFADGIDCVKPLIFRGTDDNTSVPRKREEKLFDSRVVVKFSPKGYASTPIMLFWLEFMLLPVLGTGPTLVMDLFEPHSTQSIKDWLHARRIILSLVLGSCTGLVQPLGVSVNRPFKDVLKQAIDDAVDLAEKQLSPASDSINQGTTEKGGGAVVAGAGGGRRGKHWQSAASKMRVMMTQCVWAGHGSGSIEKNAKLLSVALDV